MFNPDFYSTPPEVMATHPRISELPETYRHPRHFWIFDLPEMETQIWLARFRQSEQIWLASPYRKTTNA